VGQLPVADTDSDVDIYIVSATDTPTESVSCQGDKNKVDTFRSEKVHASRNI